MPSSKQTAQKLAAELGLTICGEPDTLGLCVDSPFGKVFRANYGHCLVAAKDKDSDPAGELWADLADRLKLGLENCPDPTCDYCYDELHRGA